MEEKQLIELIRQNDDAAFRELLKMYEGFIYKNIAALNLECGEYMIDRQDLYQEACLALYLACQNYKDDMNCKFSSFAYLIIKRKLINFCKKQSTAIKQEIKSIDRVNEEYFLRYIRSYTHSKRQKEIEYLASDIKCINNFKETLSPIDKEIVRQRIEEKSYSDIAKSLNIKIKTVYNHIDRMRRKFKQYKDEEYYKDYKYQTGM